MKKDLNYKIFYQQGAILEIIVSSVFIINLLGIPTYLWGYMYSKHIAFLIFLIGTFVVDLYAVIVAIFRLHKIKIDNETISEISRNKVVAECKFEDIEYISIEYVGKLSNVYIHSKNIKTYGKCKHLKSSYIGQNEQIIEFLYRDDSIETLRKFYSGIIEDKRNKM